MMRAAATCTLVVATLGIAPITGDTQSIPSPMTMPSAAMPLRSIRIVLGADTLAGLPRRTITVTEEHGGSATYSGVDVDAVLVRAGAPAGKAVSGSALAAYVLVRASDGYRAIFALPELDPAFTDRIVLLADQRDGVALSPQLGPYRIVAVGEKRAARWVRNVTEIDLEPAP